MFRDKATINLKAGKGGNGGVFFDFTRKPSGGFGGDGGNVYLEGTNSMFHLSNIKHGENFGAENGGMGGNGNMNGANGKDFVLKVPIATVVFNEEGEKILEIENDGEKKLLLKGGKGGVGNYFYRSKGWDALRRFKPGAKGEEMRATIAMELKSDIIFIGLPNAGKSSLLSALTNADAKVAPYAFTTIIPQLGKLGELTLMDLPGLIEQTHKGKGLGTRFVKHTKRTEMIAHFLSLESEDILADYKTIRDELKAIDEHLSQLPEVIVLTKADVLMPEEREKVKKQIEKKLKKPTIISSVYDLDGLEQIKKFLQAEISKVKKENEEKLVKSVEINPPEEVIDN